MAHYEMMYKKFNKEHRPQMYKEMEEEGSLQASAIRKAEQTRLMIRSLTLNNAMSEVEAEHIAIQEALYTL